MEQKQFSEPEIKILRQLCRLFISNKIPKSKEKVKLLIKYKNAFSDREINVIKLICSEFSTNEIATKMKLSARGVEKIRARIFVKTNSKNVVGLVKYAIINRIFTLK